MEEITRRTRRTHEETRSKSPPLSSEFSLHSLYLILHLTHSSERCFHARTHHLVGSCSHPSSFSNHGERAVDREKLSVICCLQVRLDGVQSQSYLHSLETVLVL